VGPSGNGKIIVKSLNAQGSLWVKAKLEFFKENAIGVRKFKLCGGRKKDTLQEGSRATHDLLRG